MPSRVGKSPTGGGCGDRTAWISGLRTTKTKETQCLPESGQHCTEHCNSWAGAHSTSAAQFGRCSADFEQESTLTDVAAKAKTVATRTRQQRWRDSQTERESKRAAKREKAAADKERAHRLRAPLGRDNSAGAKRSNSVRARVKRRGRRQRRTKSEHEGFASRGAGPHPAGPP